MRDEGILLGLAGPMDLVQEQDGSRPVKSQADGSLRVATRRDTGGDMARRKKSAAEFIEGYALFVPLVLGDMTEHLGKAAQEWSLAVEAARRGDLDKALTHVVEVGIAVDVPLRVGRSELRSITERAGNRLDAELPDDDEDPN
jgi:hypothetical protein